MVKLIAVAFSNLNEVLHQRL